MEGYFTAFDCKRDATVVGSIRIYFYCALATRHCKTLNQSTEEAIPRELSSPQETFNYIFLHIRISRENLVLRHSITKFVFHSPISYFMLNGRRNLVLRHSNTNVCNSPKFGSARLFLSARLGYIQGAELKII